MFPLIVGICAVTLLAAHCLGRVRNFRRTIKSSRAGSSLPAELHPDFFLMYGKTKFAGSGRWG
jgi:hypothetical protein